MKTFYKNKKVLITGGLGFIGSTLAIELVKREADVTLVDSMIPDYGGNLFNINPIKKKVKLNFSDIRDTHSLNYLVQEKDIIFNLAGTLSHVDSMTDPMTDLEVNCRAQLSLLESVRHFNKDVKIIYGGTRNQYGKANYIPVDENHAQDPTDINGIHAIAAEKYHLMYTRVYGIDSISLRMTNTYGPRHQMRHSKQGVLNWFIRQILDGEKIKLYGGGSQVRDVNFVDDVVNALLVVGSSKIGWGEAYNLGGIPVSLQSFVEKAIQVSGQGSFEIEQFPPGRKKIEVGNYIASWSRIKDIFGWAPKVTLEKGIKKTIKYYKKNKKHYW